MKKMTYADPPASLKMALRHLASIWRNSHSLESIKQFFLSSAFRVPF